MTRQRYANVVTFAAVLKGLAWATIAAELIVAVDLLTRFDEVAGDGGSPKLTGASVGMLTLALVGAVLVPCVLGFFAYTLELLVGIFDQSGEVPARVSRTDWEADLSQVG